MTPRASCIFTSAEPKKNTAHGRREDEDGFRSLTSKIKLEKQEAAAIIWKKCARIPSDLLSKHFIT